MKGIKKGHGNASKQAINPEERVNQARYWKCGVAQPTNCIHTSRMVSPRHALPCLASQSHLIAPIPSNPIQSQGFQAFRCLLSIGHTDTSPLLSSVLYTPEFHDMLCCTVPRFLLAAGNERLPF